jgi:hypothetical protein
MKSAQIDVKEYSYFVDNQWREAAGKKFFEVCEPCSVGVSQLMRVHRKHSLTVADGASTDRQTHASPDLRHDLMRFQP